MADSTTKSNNALSAGKTIWRSLFVLAAFSTVVFVSAWAVLKSGYFATNELHLESANPDSVSALEKLTPPISDSLSDSTLKETIGEIKTSAAGENEVVVPRFGPGPKILTGASPIDPISATQLKQIRVRQHLLLALANSKTLGQSVLVSNSLKSALGEASALKTNLDLIDALNHAVQATASMGPTQRIQIRNRLKGLLQEIRMQGDGHTELLNPERPTSFIVDNDAASSIWRNIGEGFSNMYQIRRVEDASQVIGNNGESIRILYIAIALERAVIALNQADNLQFQAALEDAKIDLTRARSFSGGAFSRMEETLEELASVNIGADVEAIHEALRLAYANSPDRQNKQDELP